jgi:hypothetical protein
MRKAPNLIMTLIVALALSMHALGGMRGLVLCLSTGGHVAVESTHLDPSCVNLCGLLSAQSADQARMAQIDSHSCTDITLAVPNDRIERNRTTATLTELDWKPITPCDPGLLSNHGQTFDAGQSPMSNVECMSSPAAPHDALCTVILRL